MKQRVPEIDQNGAVAEVDEVERVDQAGFADFLPIARVLPPVVDIFQVGRRNPGIFLRTFSGRLRYD